MMFDLSGKTAFITGGAGLLGEKYAEAIIEHGGVAIIADNDKLATERVAKSLGKNAIPLSVDITDKEMLEHSVKQFSKIDILINNAAKDPKPDNMSNETKFENMSMEYWLDGLDVALNGTFLCSQIISQKMIQAGGGVILNISSDLGIIAPDQRIYDKNTPKPITYSASKWAIIGMTKYLATYFADKNIRVNSLCPAGVFKESFPDDFVNRLTNLIPMGRMASADDYKGAIVFMCSDASSYMTGTNLIIDGGRTTW